MQRTKSMKYIIEQAKLSVNKEYLKQVMNLILDNPDVNNHRKLYNIYYEIRKVGKKEVSEYQNRMSFKEFDKLIIEAEYKLNNDSFDELVEFLS